MNNKSKTTISTGAVMTGCALAAVGLVAWAAWPKKASKAGASGLRAPQTPKGKTRSDSNGGRSKPGGRSSQPLPPGVRGEARFVEGYVIVVQEMGPYGYATVYPRGAWEQAVAKRERLEPVHRVVKPGVPAALLAAKEYVGRQPKRTMG